MSRRQKHEDHFKVWLWHSALVDLCGVLEDFVSEDYAKKLAAGVACKFGSAELLMNFDDFYAVVGPEWDNRARKLSKKLDAQLQWFKAQAERVIHSCSEPTSPEYFFWLYQRLRDGLPVDTADAPHGRGRILVSDAELVESDSWKQLQKAAAALLDSLQQLI